MRLDHVVSSYSTWSRSKTQTLCWLFTQSDYGNNCTSQLFSFNNISVIRKGFISWRSAIFLLLSHQSHLALSVKLIFSTYNSHGNSILPVKCIEHQCHKCILTCSWSLPSSVTIQWVEVSTCAELKMMVTTTTNLSIIWNIRRTITQCWLWSA